MEIYFLDRNFEVADGPIDTMTFAVWEERFFETGSFTLRFSASELARAGAAEYVLCVTERGELCGRVERVSADGGGECEIGGRLLECLLSDVVLRGGECYTGAIADVLRAVLEDALKNTSVKLAEDFCMLEGEVALVTEWKNLDEWLYATLKPHVASFRVKLTDGVPTLSVEVGADLTSRAVFSTSYGNIGGVEYERDVSDTKNFAYICGSDGQTVTVDKSGGGTRREIFKYAADIVRDRFACDEEYFSALMHRGEEVLAAYPEAVSVFAECVDGGGLTFGVDYTLGDLCGVVDAELGLSFALRVTGAATVFEDGGCTVYPTFGEEIGYIKKLRRTG